MILVRDLHARVVDTDGTLIRELTRTLDPTRDYQPHHQCSEESGQDAGEEYLF